MDSKKVKLIFEKLQQSNPTPKIELNYTNHFTLLVAIVLSARTTDVSVNKITKELFNIANTPEKMLNLGQNELKKRISSIGLYNSKAKNIIGLSKILVERYESKVPSDFDDLVSLPGVGRKSANVFLNSGLGIPTLAIDTHVFRVSNRVGLVKEKDVFKTEQSLLNVVPKKYLLYAHHWLVLHGRYVCKAQKPSCETCIIHDLCEFERKRYKVLAHHSDIPSFYHPNS
ncbi:endonuclease III [Wolbachia endosymbiont of Armadillidium vulgare str. wVulC]|uniref:endonuclease III n=1 Tax=Wolbachia endosymbiont of Armadillidium vulgare TaxID=77039 RepID=UPI00064B6C10|nr:endonuclease III [Wolbachia endosymbiont of Armadillidium vulgare]KLT23362.1 endonuclease III [Wolbachia endosymbiont of Armadillidium vulgare str. wVulC]OJH31322.1 Endonuclease III [Wolbachia endosymbiont of Armadillidium vulgare]OJH32367.1 Endonuclease III [Wolbachia endosymbiont of Armadillidium vulgare]